jgi:hypothetical protein
VGIQRLVAETFHVDLKNALVIGYVDLLGHWSIYVEGQTRSHSAGKSMFRVLSQWFVIQFGKD